ncbi:hypothetical protein [Rubrivivax rivuli]|uniref:Uncharacterized protein n=1 Tax=Rubrivivax rivuli TaxID=1862385 RepID=A0A437RAI4_9BURK|nr:hypothetical protein [Rubrivivax rivuli]RVU43753.1 hypothetical protein EOE66_18940 [Rubrivivax rivuli]
MQPRRTLRTVSGLLAVALSLPSASAWAGPADELRDLVGARGAGGEAELERRGYTHIDTSKSSNAAFSYWWHNGKRSCIRVTTREGRYQALADADASDCGQTRKEGGMSDGAKVAVGAAALLGIAALAHKSHHRDDRDYNEQQTADFERGYRDGLYNNSYHSRGSGSEYSDGYNKGVEERRQQSSYRQFNDGAGWTRCASEDQYCKVNGTARVRYGADNRYEYRNVTGGIQCSYKIFGDPAYGVHKTCEYMPTGGGYGSVNHGSGWEYCGSEGGYCSFNGPGEVRYGVNGKFIVRRANNGMPCDVNTFGDDPAYGQKKSCFVRRSGR